MRNFVIVFLLTLANLSCSTDNDRKNMHTQNSLDTVPQTLGIGWLEVTADYPIPIYKNLVDSLPYEILKLKIKKPLFSPDNTDEWKVVFKTKTSMQPHSFGWNNGCTVIFRVVDTVGNFYRVVANEETFQTCFINIDEYRKYNHVALSDANPYKFIYEYESWLEYMRRSHRFIEKKNIVIYDRPNGNVIFEDTINDFLPFSVADMDGDWIKLEKMDIYRDRYRNSVNYDGWVQWKDGEKLLIQLLELQ